MVAIVDARFSLLNFSAIAGFPNDVPTMAESGYFLLRFREKEEDNSTHHVIKFHQYMDQLSIHHEDVLMKMFMYSLDGPARQWYRTLPPSSISSFKDFHDAFYLYCKRIYPAECLFEDCCRGYALYIQGLEAYFSSSKDEAGGYDMKEEDPLSSSNYILQEEIFQNSDNKVDDSIIEQKSSSLEINQNTPFYDEDIEVLDLY